LKVQGSRCRVEGLYEKALAFKVSGNYVYYKACKKPFHIKVGATWHEATYCVKSRSITPNVNPACHISTYHVVAVVHRVSSSLFGPVDPSFRVLSGRLEFTVQRHKFNTDSLSVGP